MKSKSQKILCIVAFATLYTPANKTISFGAVTQGITKGVEIAGHISTGVEIAMNIANIGVTLWGSAQDREKMAKGLAITSVITAIGQGDLQKAQDYADNIRDSSLAQIQYTPLTGNDLVDADIVVTGSGQPHARSFGDISSITDDRINTLRANKKVITVDDTKIADFQLLKKQLVFSAFLPKDNNEEKIYQLMNGIEIIFKAVTPSNDSSKRNIICYRVYPAMENQKNGAKLKEFVTITVSLSELNKQFFFGTTNNQLSVFYNDNNTIIKKSLIEKMI